MVPRVTIQGQHYVCNRLENEFEPTDGNGYRDWFNEKNRITDGNLKRAVRMLKYPQGVTRATSPLSPYCSRP